MGPKKLSGSDRVEPYVTIMGQRKLAMIAVAVIHNTCID